MKRARYDGPHTAVTVSLPEGREVVVERGHQLPTEVDGQPIPAAIRDDLLSRSDWSEVKQTPPTTEKKED